MSAIGKNIKAFRLDRKLTLEELALKARVGTRTLEKYETGEKVPDLQTIMKLSTVLDVPASEILEQESRNDQSAIDQELTDLIEEVGTKKAKLFLKMAREIREEDLLKLKGF
ncbi:helix-turn-helix domain-containing protein [Bacillus massilinigeriensis]|uniref:helix-turn-helix domain-containing protein n=1 Tax=Bacillus mediterraneensis TaxID=1805474 RepID=UPI0008F86A0D|nr:helix-turn-helix transcriptional regulator [Bacillus mediterraneensis]